MDDRLLSVSWAEIDEPDGVQRIVSTSSGRSDLGEYVGWHPQGVPDSRLPDDAPGAPPWVTFGPVEDDTADKKDPARTLISVSVLSKSSRRAADGRRIFPRKIFFIPYAKVAPLGASYRVLWDALSGVEIPTPDGGPATVQVPEQSMESLAATIDRYGLARMIAIASAMLEGRIALSDLGSLSREDRLDLLDAIMALLPYAFRSVKSAATAIDNTVTHHLDVVFADIVRGQSRITMSSDAEIPRPVTEEGQRYQRLLHDKIAHSRLLPVIGHLWSQWSAPSIPDLSYAYASLGQFDLDNTFVRLVKSRKATRRDVVDFFHHTNSDISDIWDRSLRPDDRKYAIDRLLTSIDSRVETLLRDHWKTIWPDLLDLASLSMDAGNVTRPLWCLELARSTSIGGADDLLLEGLLASNAAAPHARTKRSDALVRVLLNVDIRAGTNEYSRTRKHVWLDNDQSWVSYIFRELLARESANNMSKVLDYVDWLCSTDNRTADAAAPEWIRALRLVYLGRTDSTQYPQVTDPVWNALFIRMAHCSRQLPEVLSLIDDDLIRIGIEAFRPSRSDGSPRRDGLEFLSTVLGGIDLQRQGVNPDEAARVDAVRTMLGTGPLEFPADGDEQARELYVDGLREVFRVGATERLRPWLAKKYLEFAAPAKGNGTLTPGAITLLNMWSADPDLKGEVAAHVVAMAKAARPMAPELSGEYWQCVASRPELEAYAMTPSLVATARETISAPLIHLHRGLADGAVGGVPNTKLALACYEAYQYGMPPTALLNALKQAGADHLDPKLLDELLREFQGLLFRGRPGGRASEEVLRDCYVSIAEGALGESYADAFVPFVDRRLDHGAQFLTMTRHEIKRAYARRTGGKPVPGVALAVRSESSERPTPADGADLRGNRLPAGLRKLRGRMSRRQRPGSGAHE